MLPVAIPAAIELAKLVGPWLVGKVAGEKAGKIAEQVAAHAAAVTGEADPTLALQRLQADPELLVRYRARIMEHAEQIDRMYLADRQDARSRDVELHKLGYINKRADLMVAIAFVSLIVIIVLVWHARESMPGEVFGLFNTACGYLLKMLGDAFAFEFGSSRGSKEKDTWRANG